MPLVFLIPFLLMSPELYASVAPLNFPSSPFIAGLASNFTNVDHICFCLVAGQLLFVRYRKPWLIGSVLAGTSLGIGLVAELGPFPFAQVAVAISLILLVVMLSLPHKFEKYLILAFASLGLVHGLLHANRWGSFVTLRGEIDFTLGVALGFATLSMCFGIIMRSLSEKAQGLHKEVEHILVATASGAALAYFVIAFS